MTTQLSVNRPAEVIDRLFAAFNRYDATAFGACYSVDTVFEDTALRKFFHGRGAIEEFLRVWVAACPDSRIDVDEVIIGDGKAAAAWVGTGTLTGEFEHLPPTAVRGSTIRQRGLSVFEFDADGLIKRQTDYYDVLAILQQIGVLPE